MMTHLPLLLDLLVQGPLNRLLNLDLCMHHYVRRYETRALYGRYETRDYGTVA